MFITRGSKQYAERLRDRIRELLDRDCGVRLSDEKTRITHVRDGFDFLGFSMTLGVGKGGHLVPKIKVPRKATTRIVQRLNEAMRFRPLQESGAARIVRGSAVIRGWSSVIGHVIGHVIGQWHVVRSRITNRVGTRYRGV